MCRGKNINSPSLSVFFRSLIMLYLSLRPAVFLLICKESPSLYWMPKHASKLTSLRLPSRLILLFWTSLHHECSLHILNNLCQKRFGHIEGLLAIIEVVDLAVHDHSVRSTGRLVTWLGVAFTGPGNSSGVALCSEHDGLNLDSTTYDTASSSPITNVVAIVSLHSSSSNVQYDRWH
ncbi:hypothetical protein ES288_A03G179800v1 [Gossypium darwinii]|uniref:Uncharacterized protein n=1 Tax=Gossypium darwinii TaxID=34276 RepID=A0A5D2H5U5_GOSDA|nr:hypothetical protein ES288_A03G179800v1 [Gossypium darwinii]